MGRPSGPVCQQIVIESALDPYLPLRGLASYCGLSVRTLRGHLDDPARPLPHYHVGGKILVRRSEFDAWMAANHRADRVDLDAAVDEILRDL